MTGCDCGGNAHNEEHADDCAGWRLEVERLRAEVERLEALFQQTHGVHHSWVDARHRVAQRQREACAQVAARAVEPAAVGGYGRHLVDDTLEAIRATPLVTENEP